MGFHRPVGPNSVPMPKYVPSEFIDFIRDLIGPFLNKDEIYLSHALYGTKDKTIAAHEFGASLGRIILTNNRIFFWADRMSFPHLAIDLESFSILRKMRLFNQTSIFFSVNGEEHMFQTNKKMADLIESKIK